MRRTRPVIWRVFISGCSCLWLAIAGQPAVAAERLSADNPDTTATYESADSATEVATEPQLTKHAVWLAFMMWAGIIFGGVILLALVVMWGNRTRRFARSPLPPVAKRDELWFLKPKPPADDAEGTGPPESSSSVDP